MDYGIKGKIAFITGAAQGIGFATAKAMAAEGVDLMLNDLEIEAISKAAEEVRKVNPEVRILPVAGDISSEEDVKRMFDTCHKELGKVSIMINNAAYSPKTPFDQISAEEFSRVMNINLLGTFLCSKYAFEDMRDEHWGRIVNLSSIAGRLGANDAGLHYSTTKGGVVSMTLTQAKKMGPFGVTSNAVAPGRIYTRLTRVLPEERIKQIEADIPMRRIGEPEEIASVICFLASQQASYVSGAVIDVRGGYIA